MKMHRKSLTVFLMAGLVIPPSGQAGLPPSAQTNEETMWNALSVSAQLDLNSSQTEALMQKFLATHSEHPKAILTQYMMAEGEFKKGNFQKAAVRYESFLTKYPEHEL